VINGSPRKERGVTGGVLSLFVEGMKDAGAEVDVIYSKGLDIEDCRGCFNCWDQTPGKCVQKDDMTEVLDKLADADLTLLATPVYVDGMTGSLKTLLDRSIPLLHGYFVIRDDHCRHERREHVKSGKMALVSVSGFTEMDNFDPLITHVKAISKNMDRDYIGALLRPYGWILKPAEAQGAPMGDIYNAIKEAGKQLISDGKMKEETLAVAARDIVPREQVITIMQGHYGGK
jgi:multimeric flavodoxin WrbA